MTLYEFNADEAAFDVVEYEPTMPAPHGIEITGHWRLCPHDADRCRHNIRRYNEEQARREHAIVMAAHSRFEVADRAWRMEAKR